MSKNFRTHKYVNKLKEYDIYRRWDPKDADPYVKGIPYVFITTPKINLSDTNVQRDNFLLYMRDVEKDLFDVITAGGRQTFSPFIRLFSNAFKTLNGKDLAARTIDVNETFYGYKQTLPISIVDSQVGDTVTLDFKEYKNLPIVKLHKIWVDYTEKVRRGLFAPSTKAIQQRYIDYVSSIYYFVVDFDGETILYWSKYTGAVPISVPYAELVANGKEHDIPELSVEYVYSYKEDLDPGIIMDFNKVATLDSDALKYEADTPQSGVIPYITNDLLPYDFQEDDIKYSNVIIAKTDAYDGGGINPKKNFKLKFVK